MELLNLFEDLCDENRSIELLENALFEANLAKSDEDNVNDVEKKVVTLINKKLENYGTLCQGFHLIAKFSSQISKELLKSYYPHWFPKLKNSLINAKLEDLHIVCQATSALVKSCKQVHELDKTISSLDIKQIVEIISKRFGTEKNENLLNLLVVILYYYPHSCVACMAHLRSQENFSEIILSCVDENRKELVNSGAKSYCLLVRALERSFHHSSKDNANRSNTENYSAKCHTLHQMNLCNNLNIIMGELFQELITSAKDLSFELPSVNDNKILKLPELPELTSGSLLENYIKLENRFTNICNYLSALLRTGSSNGQKFVQPDVVLKIIQRGISVTPTNFNKTNESKKKILLYILPNLHAALLHVLEALIDSFGQDLLVHAISIQRFILQTLVWTKSYTQKSVQNLRIHAYKVLSCWLKKMKFLSGFQLIANEFIVHIENDLSSNKEILTLKPKVQGKASKKSKETVATKNSQQSSTNFTSIDLSLQVLSTVEFIISNANNQLTQPFYNTLKNIVLKLHYEQNINKHENKFYNSNADYNLQLTRTLNTFQTFTHYSTSSSTQIAIQTLNRVISQDDNLSNTNEAYHGLANIKSIVYPAAPTLSLPITESLIIQPSMSNSLQLNENLFSPQSVFEKRVLENGNCTENVLSKRQKL